MLTLMAWLLGAGLAYADEDKERERRRDERRLSGLEARAKKFAASDASELSVFLQQESARVLERCRALLPSSSYRFDRMLEALDDLLDTRDDLQEAASPANSRRKEDDERRETAKRLERAYFRVQQADYFAKLSEDKHASEYIGFSRQLYQRARTAYDAQEYHRANHLASASSELVSVLENFAQSAVRKPEPPELK